MSEKLKRSLSCENASDSGEELHEKRAKMAHDKNSLMVLNELCQRVSQKIDFIELGLNDPEIPRYLISAEKKFWFKCCALGKSAIEGGPTKKLAKHASATLVLRKIKGGRDDSDSDEDTQKHAKEDYVTELLNFCVLKNYHKPQFACVDSYGPSHDPRFTFECRLDSIVRKATHNTKNQSKQTAAKKVLDVVKSFYPDIEKKIAIINDENLVKEETRKKITSYIKLKEMGKVDNMGATLSERSNFFLKHNNDEFVNALKEILAKNTSNDAKYEELKKELETMWPCKVDDYYDTGLKQFECFVDFEQFTVSLLATENELKREVVKYFCEMLNIPVTAH